MTMANGQEGEPWKSDVRYVNVGTRLAIDHKTSLCSGGLTLPSHGVKMEGLPKTAHFTVFLSSFCLMMLTDPFPTGGTPPRMSMASWGRLDGDPGYE